MTRALASWIDAFAGLRVLVIGEAMLDVYVRGNSTRLTPEAPVPVVNVDHEELYAGGAANTAANVAALGARATLLSACGDDPEGRALRAILASAGVATGALLADPGRVTLSKRRICAGSQMLVRCDQGTCTTVARATEARLVGAACAAWPRIDAVVISDYGYGVLTPGLIEALARLQARRPKVIVLDTGHPGAFSGLRCTAYKPNHHQALAVLGCDAPGDPAELLGLEGHRLLDIVDTRIAAVTMGDAGTLLFERGRVPCRVAARTVARPSPSGAGDTFAAALTLALAAGAPGRVAVEAGSVAAAVAVTHHATGCCSEAELRAALAPGPDASPLPEALARVEAVRRGGGRVVFTNGCFDILHAGHIGLLRAARELGDLLVVGLNSDVSVARLKGPGRPVNSERDRARVLAALDCVDLVLLFDEDRPDSLIRDLRPDVFVKGGDYADASLPEAPLVRALGGQVRILPFADGFSTTTVIERIRATAAAG